MKNFLALFFIFVCTSAAAEWVKVSESDLGEAYIDTKIIKRNGNVRRAWVLFNLRSKNAEGMKSVRDHQEFDCSESRVKTIQQTWWSEDNAQGKELTPVNLRPDDWQYVAPGTVGETKLNFVCRYR